MFHWEKITIFFSIMQWYVPVPCIGVDGTLYHPMAASKYLQKKELSLLPFEALKVSLASLFVKNRLLCNITLYTHCLCSGYGRSKRLFDSHSIRISFILSFCLSCLVLSFFFWGGGGVKNLILVTKGHPKKFL